MLGRIWAYVSGLTGRRAKYWQLPGIITKQMDRPMASQDAPGQDAGHQTIVPQDARHIVHSITPRPCASRPIRSWQGPQRAQSSKRLWVDDSLPPKLTIEMVPATAWFQNVRSVVSEEEWNLIRNRVYDLANHCCEICKNKGLVWPVECHEIWHYDIPTQVQQLIDFEALCPDCHLVKHIGYAEFRGLGTYAMNHLMAVNHWSRVRTERYVAEARQKVKYLSQRTWALDLAPLRLFGIEPPTIISG